MIDCLVNAYLELGQFDEAISELRKAAELAPDDPVAHAALAKALEAKGLTGEAQAEMRKAQESRRHDIPK